jgi:hypothetical protein
VLYYNFAVGECADLVWGVSLLDYATARALPEGEVPKIVRICLREVDARGLEAEGIYRVRLLSAVLGDEGLRAMQISGRHASVLEVRMPVARSTGRAESDAGCMRSFSAGTSFPSAHSSSIRAPTTSSSCPRC